MVLRGTFTAIVTPFIKDRVDEEGLAYHIEKQIEAGITGIVFLGSTGEEAVLRPEERKRIIEMAVERVQGRCLVIVGTGCSSTQETVEKTAQARALGADMALVVTPYYNKPNQEGIYLHFEKIVSSVDIPVIVYNNPGRTGVNIEVATLLKLAQLTSIVGVKEASGNMLHIADVIHTVCARYPGFSVLSGDDGMTLPALSLGAHGVISVISNLVPKPLIDLVAMALNGDFLGARSIHNTLFSLMKMAFIEVNPTPIKSAMRLCGLPAGPCRLPLCAMKTENQDKLAELLLQMGLACSSNVL